MRLWFLFILFAALQSNASAQLRPVGIAWTIPKTDKESLEQIEHLYANGFRHIYLQGVPGPAELFALRSRGMYVLQQFPLYYLTPYTVRSRQDRIEESLFQYDKAYQNYPNFEGISLFYEGSIDHRDMMKEVSGWLSSKSRPYPSFFATHQLTEDTLVQNLAPIFLAKSLDEAFQHSARYPDRPLVLEWLDDIETTEYIWYRLIKQPGSGRIYLPYQVLQDTAQYGVVLKTLRRLQNDPEDILVGRYTPDSPDEKGSTLISFLLLSFVFLSYYSFDPNYRKSVQRFFRSNKMFMDEVFNRRLRLPFPSLLVFVSSILLYGILHLAVYEYLVNDPVAFMIGSLFPKYVLDHLAWMSFGFGVGYGSLVLWFLMLWGTTMNRRSCNFSQFTLVFLWPMHILFYIGLLMIFFVTSLPNPSILFLLWMLTMGLPLIAYLYVNLKLSRYGKRRGVLYQLLKMTPVLGGALYGIYQLYYHSPFFEYIHLALSLGIQ